MYKSLEALTDPLIRIRLEAMYPELLDTDPTYKCCCKKVISTSTSLGTPHPRNSRILLFSMKTLNSPFKPLLNALSTCKASRMRSISPMSCGVPLLLLNSILALHFPVFILFPVSIL